MSKPLVRAHYFARASVSCGDGTDSLGLTACSTTLSNQVDRRVSFFRRSHVRRSVMFNGFTLMELLIVIAVILILMLMAVPSIGTMKKHANETSAVNSVQTIVAAEMMYETSYPTKGYACSLSELGGDPSSGAPTAEAAELIQADLASGYKAGYIFKITNCLKSNVSGSSYVKAYTVTAIPQAVGKTGDRGFCIDQNGGSPKYDLSGGTNCTQLLQ